MTSSRDRRVAKELQDIQADRDNSGVYAAPIDDVNLKHLKGTIPGPPDTPYYGGTFIIDIRIPDNYPFKSPSMSFSTKIWHPNVSSQTVRHPMRPVIASRAPLWYSAWAVKSPTNRTLGSHLPRHPWVRLVASPDHQDRTAIYSHAPRSS